jgi:hypothetical protein
MFLLTWAVEARGGIAQLPAIRSEAPRRFLRSAAKPSRVAQPSEDCGRLVTCPPVIN